MQLRQAHSLHLTFIAQHQANYRGRLFNDLSRTRCIPSASLRWFITVHQDSSFFKMIHSATFRPTVASGPTVNSNYHFRVRSVRDMSKRPLPYPNRRSDVKLLPNRFSNFFSLVFGKRVDGYFPRAMCDLRRVSRFIYQRRMVHDSRRVSYKIRYIAANRTVGRTHVRSRICFRVARSRAHTHARITRVFREQRRQDSRNTCRMTAGVQPHRALPLQVNRAIPRGRVLRL